MSNAHDAIVWFFVMLLVPTTVLVAANCFLVLNSTSTEKFAVFMTRFTAILLLLSFVGCYVTYGIQWWDLLGIFSAVMLIFFASLMRASLFLVVIASKAPDVPSSPTPQQSLGGHR